MSFRRWAHLKASPTSLNGLHYSLFCDFSPEEFVSSRAYSDCKAHERCSIRHRKKAYSSQSLHLSECNLAFKNVTEAKLIVWWTS